MKHRSKVVSGHLATIGYPGRADIGLTKGVLNKVSPKLHWLPADQTKHLKKS